MDIGFYIGVVLSIVPPTSFGPTRNFDRSSCTYAEKLRGWECEAIRIL